VHLFLLHPSPALWERVTTLEANLHAVAVRAGLRRAEDPTAGLAHNPLLASWGRDARESQLVVAATAGPGVVHHHRPLATAPATLLGRVQAAIRADRAVPGSPLPGQPDGRALLAPDDRSLSVHACHGRARQVEVVRDAVLHLLAQDPSLELRDVIVMCPDIEAYAPLIHASFGAAVDLPDLPDAPHAPAPAPARGTPDTASAPAASSGLPALQVRLADRSLRQTNPVLGVVAALLGLAASRVTATEVLDLIGREPVRRRFGLDDEDVSRLERWVSDAGVRWGFDAEQRAPFRLGGLHAGTWEAGLDRTLLGVAMADAEQRLFAGVVPLDDVDSGDIALAGRYAEMVERLEAALVTFSAPKTIAEWALTIVGATDALTTTTDRDAWQRAQLGSLLDDVVGEATVRGAPSAAVLSVAELGALLGDRLEGRPTRANFRTGQLTICTLVPMRSVPHRVVCLLGLDDGVFPRAGDRDGDDLILADALVGDRDARSEDRQLLLDAVLAATDHLVITYTGRDDRTNLERPPAVPVGELLDVVDRTVRTTAPGRDGRSPLARASVVVHHPLQPFDQRNFCVGELVAGMPWSFDVVNLEGARARRAPRVETGRFLAAALPARPDVAVELTQLERFVRHPVRAFLRERLGIFLDDRATEIDDTLAVELDALEEWEVGDRLLAARLAGATGEACLAAEAARGLLPPGGLGRPTLRKVGAAVEMLVAETLAMTGGRTPCSLDVNLDLSGGVVLTGVVPGVVDDVVTTTTYSRLGPTHRLVTWVRLLAVTASRPDRPLEAVTIGRSTKAKACAVARIAPLADDPEARRAVASTQLVRLIELMGRGLREPLPLYAKTSAAWAAGGRDPLRAARDQWESGHKRPGECEDPEHRLVLAGSASEAGAGQAVRGGAGQAVRAGANQAVRGGAGEGGAGASPLSITLPVSARAPVAFDRVLVELALADEVGDGWDPSEQTRFGRYAHALWDGLLAHERLEVR